MILLNHGKATCTYLLPCRGKKKHVGVGRHSFSHLENTTGIAFLIAKVDWQKDNCSKQRRPISHQLNFPFAADEEHQQNVAAAAAAVARPRPHAEERGDGMPRRRRNMGNRMMAQRRAQQAEDFMEGNISFSSSWKLRNAPYQQTLRLVKGCGWLLKKVFQFCWLWVTYSLTIICLTFQLLSVLPHLISMYHLSLTEVSVSSCGEFWQFVVPTVHHNIFFAYFLETAFCISCLTMQVKFG